LPDVHIVGSGGKGYRHLGFSSKESCNEHGELENDCGVVECRELRTAGRGAAPWRGERPAACDQKPEAALPVRSLSRVRGQCTLGAYLRGEVRRSGLLLWSGDARRVTLGIHLTGASQIRVKVRRCFASPPFGAGAAPSRVAFERSYNKYVLRIICHAALACELLVGAGGALRAADEGTVQLLKRTTSASNSFTDAPTLDLQQWMSDHFWRMVVFSPYFDSRTRWYPNGWIYIDSYAIYVQPPSWMPDLAAAHPDWILHDAAGKRLYIPWGCDAAGGCPQYAADFSNPGFRQWWIGNAQAQLARGAYRGVWIDDVNMDFRVGDSKGNAVTPVNRLTGAPMDETTWRSAFAGFMEQVRSELPSIEIAHNAIWYAGGSARQSDPNVSREILASDLINIEHGVNDGGLTGGAGQWSLRALLGYVDAVHQDGRSVILGDAGGDAPTGPSLEYALACYFLISTGSDAIGDGGFASPDNWWTGFDALLGAAAGPRYDWQGLLRRDFADGIVLVREPGSASVTVQLPVAYTRLDGSVATSVTLGSSEGAVLRRSPLRPPPARRPAGALPIAPR
jgi:hypothetical protein